MFMILAEGARPRAILLRLALIVVGGALLAGCQSAAKTPGPEVRSAGWRVVERVGEARYLAPGVSSWAAALPATALPDGSRVVTGTGGRLILARAKDHVSAGPGSRFSLPGAGPGAGLEQTGGRLRYRLAGPQPLAITAPALALEARGGVFDVSVGTDATEVAVERGRLRVATADGGRQIELNDGQSARTGAHGALAFRRAGDRPFEPVERIILPALQPKAAVAEGAPPGWSPTTARAAANQASTSAAVSVQSAVAIGNAGPSAGGSEPAVAPAAVLVPAATEAPAAVAGAAERPAELDAPANVPAPKPDPTAGSEAPVAPGALPTATGADGKAVAGAAGESGSPADLDAPAIVPGPGPVPTAGSEAPVAPGALPTATGAAGKAVAGAAGEAGRPADLDAPANVPAPKPDPTAGSEAPVAPGALPTAIGADGKAVAGAAGEWGSPADLDAPAIVPGPGPVPTAGSEAPVAPGADPAAETIDDRRELFERLTAGMIDAVPAQPALQEPLSHARSR